MILQEHLERIEELWMASVEKDALLWRAPGSGEQRLAYVRCLLAEVVRAAQTYSGEAPAEHNGPPPAHVGRDFDGYTPAMVLAEVCLLRRVVSQIVQENLLAVNLSYLVPDLARVNESLDEQAQAALATMDESTAPHLKSQSAMSS